MGVMETIQDGANKVGFELGQTWDFWRNMFEEKGDTAAIDSVRDKWVGGGESVKGHIGDGKALLEQEAKVIYSFWKGPAGATFHTYQFTLGDKFTGLTDICDGISDSLEDFRETLNDFWMWTYIAMAAAAGAVAMCIASFWVAGIGVAALLATLGGLISAMVLYVTQCKQTAESIRGAINTLQNQTATSVFPNDKWPRPASGLDDGAATDGDESDWKTK